MKRGVDLNLFTVKFKEVLTTVLPITFLVIFLNFTLTPIETSMFIRFIIGAILIIIGLTIFLVGVDIGITPIGNTMGSAIVKSNKVWIVAVSGLVLGFIISIAEPDLHILAAQVERVTGSIIGKNMMVGVVSVGIAVLLSLGIVRILYSFPFSRTFTILYGLIFLLTLISSPTFLAISFDASGATTGALTVPFMLAFAVGVSKLKKKSTESEVDSFGLVGIASTGAIFGVLVMGIFVPPMDNVANDISSMAKPGIIQPFLNEILPIAKEITVALLPVLLIYIIANRMVFKQGKRTTQRTYFGVLLTFIGLILFLVGVNAGFMEVGNFIGKTLGSSDNKWISIVVGLFLGVLTILAEPAVHVLTDQIEEVTAGYVNKKTVLGTLSIGVGVAVALSVVRILVPSLQLWHLLLPGFGISVIMSYFVPPLFVGIAYDSGGVASGPMTATFILAYTQGVAEAFEGANVLVDGFGTIAMVAMTPIIALQILGLVFKMKSKKEAIINGE